MVSMLPVQVAACGPSVNGTFMAQAAHLLLEYCLSDVDLAKPESLRQLAGIQLIPMLSGALIALQLCGVPTARPLFLATRLQQEVLATARDALVACEVGYKDAACIHKIHCFGQGLRYSGRL